MHGDMILLLTFVLALVAAFAGGLVAKALRLPPIVGYLVGGLVVSPFTPGFVGDSHAMSQLAEVGVMFMMFGVGLHFSIKDLMEVKAIAIPAPCCRSPWARLPAMALRAPSAGRPRRASCWACR